MKTHPSLPCWLVGAAFIAVGSVAIAAPSTGKVNPADVDTIAHIIRADLDSVSGPTGPKNKIRQQTLYTPTASFVSLSNSGGQLKIVPMTFEQYLGPTSSEASYEREIGRRTERYGNLAGVRSIAEERGLPGGPVTARYINYYHLFFDGKRWWIAGNIWQTESPNTPIPSAWVGKWEEVTR